MKVPDSLREKPCQWCGNTTSGYLDRHNTECPYPAQIEALRKKSNEK